MLKMNRKPIHAAVVKGRVGSLKLVLTLRKRESRISAKNPRYALSVIDRDVEGAPKLFCGLIRVLKMRSWEGSFRFIFSFLLDVI